MKMVKSRPRIVTSHADNEHADKIAVRIMPRINEIMENHRFT